MPKLEGVPPHYGNHIAPETPFNKAKGEVYGLIGDGIVRAKNWRFAFLASTLTNILLGVALLILLKTSKVIPIVVGIDKERGEPIVLGDATEAVHKPGEMEIKYFLSNFIRNVRAISSDPVVVKQNWLRAYTYMKKQSADMLNQITNDDESNPLKKVGQLTLIAQPLSVVQVVGSNAYQMRWKETIFNNEGQKTDEYTMVGVFSLEVEQPSDIQTLNENPLGLYITNFQWNKELKQQG